MGLGINEKPLMGAFDTDEKKISKKLRKNFGNEIVFGLTGKPIKRSKGLKRITR